MLILKSLQRPLDQTCPYKYGGRAASSGSFVHLWTTRGLMSRREIIETEIVVFTQFRDSAVEAGLQNAALKLSEELSARMQALAKLNTSEVTTPRKF